jgi:hypothetical protein
MKKRYMACIFLILSSIKIYGQEQIVTDRPDQTEASSTVPAGYFQVEAGALFMHEQLNEQTEVRTAALPNALFRVGVVKHFELRVVVQPELIQTFVNDTELNEDFGMADLQVGFKLQLCEEKGWRPEIAVLSHLVLPTGTESYSMLNYGSINKLAFTHNLNDKHSIAYNLGYDYLGSGNGNLFYSLAWGIGISEKVGLYVEGYGYYLDMVDPEVSGDAGFTYLLNNNVQLDYSFGVGINHLMNYHHLGISFRIPN